MISAMVGALLFVAIQLDEYGCASYAQWSHDIVWARDMGADKRKVREDLAETKRKFSDRPYLALVERDFEHLWMTQVPRSDLGIVVYMDCVKRRGMYEDAT